MKWKRLPGRDLVSEDGRFKIVRHEDPGAAYLTVEWEAIDTAAVKEWDQRCWSSLLRMAKGWCEERAALEGKP